MDVGSGEAATARRVAVVTGGASGIGLACAAELARDGTELAIFDLDGTAARATAGELCGAGGTAVGFGVDVTDRVQVRRAVAATTERLGPVDILINSAGLAGSESFLSLRAETWDRLVAVNLTGTFHCAQAVAESMLARRWGRIVNIASYAGQAGVAWLTHYSASKGGVIAFTKALAREVGSFQVTVNAICPGGTETPMLQLARERERRRTSRDRDEWLERSRPKVTPAAVGRVGRPGEIAAVCGFLASDAAGFITGQAIGVNGGTQM